MREHVLFDTKGLLMYAACLQASNGGALLISSLFGLLPFLLMLYAGSSYQ